MERMIRRVTRTAAPVVPVGVAQAKANAKQTAINKITDDLKLIAKLNRQIVETATAVGTAEARVKENMLIAKETHFSDGVLEAALVDTYSSESKEIDPRVLFKHKGFKREDFFTVVKVQIGALQKVMAENEIKQIAKVTPAAKTGTVLKIKAVKTVVTTKPARGKK